MSESCSLTCSICLESLFSEEEALGVTVPCGHAIHENCFRAWEASTLAKGHGRDRVRCPQCNQSGATFMKIFISFPTTTNDGHSSEDDTDDDDNDDTDDNNNDNNDDDDDDSDDVVDLTASPVVKLDKRKSASPGATSTTKLKRRLTKYKLEYKQVQSKFQECHKNQKEILERHQDMKKALETSRQQAAEIQQEHAQHLLELTQQRLEIAQLERQYERANLVRESAEQSWKKAVDALDREKSHYQEKLTMARENRSAEFKMFMHHYPKVVEELRQTKLKLEEKEKFCATVKARMRQLDPKYKHELNRVADELDTSNSNSRQQKKRSLEVLKALNDADEEAAQAQWHTAQQEKSDTTNRYWPTSRAMGMVHAATAQAKKARMNHRSIEDVLGVGCGSTSKKHPLQSSQAISSSKAASTLHLSTTAKRRPTIDRNMASFVKQKGSVQVDIRAMFRGSK